MTTINSVLTLPDASRAKNLTDEVRVEPTGSRTGLPEHPIAQASSKGSAPAPSVVYHGNNPESPPYEINLELYENMRIEKQDHYLGARETSAERSTRFGQAFQAYSELGPAITEVKRRFDEALTSFGREHPGAMARNWDFSMDSDGSIKVLDQHDQLSQAEKGALTKALNTYGLADAMAEFAERLTGAMKLERGPTGVGGNALGQYDLNSDNFGDIIRMREILDNPVRINGQSQFPGKSENPNGAYSATGVSTIAQQLAARAEATFTPRMIRLI